MFSVINNIIGYGIFVFIAVAVGFSYYNEEKPRLGYAIQRNKSKVIMASIGIGLLSILGIFLISLIIKGMAIIGFWNWRLMP